MKACVPISQICRQGRCFSGCEVFKGKKEAFQNEILNRREPQRLLFQRVVFAALCAFLYVLCVLKTFETVSYDQKNVLLLCQLQNQNRLCRKIQIFKNKALKGFNLGDWMKTVSDAEVERISGYLQTLFIQKKIETRIQASFPLENFYEGLRAYISNMSAGKVLFRM